MAKTVVGLFDTPAEAQSVVQDLRSAGFTDSDISVLANNASGTTTDGTTTNTGTSTGAGAAKGAGTGAVVGGAAGLLAGLAGLSAFAIPGIGPVIGTGILATTLAGAGVGAVAGGLIGALTHIGVPEQDAQYYSEGVRRGGTLVLVRCDDARAQSAADILNGNGAVDIEQRGPEYASTGYTGYNPSAQPYTVDQITQERSRYGAASTGTVANAGETVIPIVEEELVVGKRQVQGGGARVHTYVTERPVEEQVTLHEEHVTVDRHPVDRAVTDADAAAFKDGTIELTETSEEAVVGKNARVVEEVVVGKTATDRTETVRDTVRRTDVDVEELNQGATLDEDRTLDTTSTTKTSGSGY